MALIVPSGADKLIISEIFVLELIEIFSDDEAALIAGSVELAFMSVELASSAVELAKNSPSDGTV